LTPKIEAASEQAPWISQIQKHIQRIESQLAQTAEQLREDAKRLGISEEDCEALLADRRMTRMPDLSPQAINQLSEPARDVRMYLSRMKQAKQQSEVDKKEADRLAKELAAALATRQHDNLHDAMTSTSELIGLLRKRLQIQEALDKQLHRRQNLEEEAVDLAADEALPVERSFMMGLLFVGGAFFALWGLAKVMPGQWFGVKLDPNSGLLLLLLGAFMLFFWFTWGNMLDRTTVGELDDCEDQLEALKKEIRKTETERDELDRRLPPHTGSLEVRLRDAEAELVTLETLLPLQHNHQAATERYKTARRRAGEAADSLRHARNQWEKTLHQLGITQSLSPKSIRIMAEGYESLLQTRKRMQALEDELDQRRLELGAITQRIDGLIRQATATKKASDEIVRASRESEAASQAASHPKEHRPDRDKRPGGGPAMAAAQQPAVRADADAASQALEQINRLTAMISEQEQYVQQRKGLKEEDAVLAKQAAGLEKGIDRLHRAHSALLAELGCESEEQLHELLDRKAKHAKLLAQHAELNDRIRAMISGAVAYDAVAKHLDNPGADELEKRWDAVQQRTAQAEKRVEQLHGRQGEISQEMKSLAADTRLPDAKLELACLENQMKACAAHWQTLAATTHMLDRVCEVYETERQPETLREASAFLNQLTEGKYVRVWTPLGKNQLRIDNAAGQALPLEVLSRGTRETVFIALRLSLAAAYARRGVMLPLVLDDVFVNFDRTRTLAAARVLRDFAALGHQVIMFTCHEHIMRIFYEIGVEVRVLPSQGQAGEARVYVPEVIAPPQPLIALEPEPVAEEPAKPEPEPVEPEPAAAEAAEIEEEPEAEVVEVVAEEEEAVPEPVIQIVPPAKVKTVIRAIEEPAEPARPTIDWLWYEDDFDPSDPIDEMAARAEAMEKGDAPELSGWIESEAAGPPPEEFAPPPPPVDDQWRERPISA
ncbi:MAG: ATP-binding protein, partial [Aureliella sp.]